MAIEAKLKVSVLKVEPVVDYSYNCNEEHEATTPIVAESINQQENIDYSHLTPPYSPLQNMAQLKTEAVSDDDDDGNAQNESIELIDIESIETVPELKQEPDNGTKTNNVYHWSNAFQKRLGRKKFIKPAEVRQILSKLDSARRVEAMTTPFGWMPSELVRDVCAAFDEWVATPSYIHSRDFDELNEEQKTCLVTVCHDVPIANNGSETEQRDSWEKRAQLATERLGLRFNERDFQRALGQVTYGDLIKEVTLEPPCKKRKYTRKPSTPLIQPNGHRQLPQDFDLTEEQKRCLVAVMFDVPIVGRFNHNPIGRLEQWQKRAQLTSERLGVKFTVDEYQRALRKASTAQRVSIVKAARNLL